MSKPLAEVGSLVVAGLRFQQLIDADAIAEGIAGVASQLCERYADAEPVMVCVLNGAAIFHADLIRRMPIALEVDYLRVASYYGAQESSGSIIFTAEPGTQTAGRNVILVEDIVDTGRTIDRLREYFLRQRAASVEVAALLYKPDAHRTGRPPEYIAFEIPNRFVVGFGLDYRHQGRNLPAIYVLEVPVILQQNEHFHEQ